MPSTIRSSSPSSKESFMNMFRIPTTNKADIIIEPSCQKKMENIVAKVKNHEFRKYLIATSVKRLWFYTSDPVKRIEYVALISRGRSPGEVPNDGGLGNEDFNVGSKVSKFGYEIRKLWRLSPPIHLQTAIDRGYLKAPPQKYNYVQPKVFSDYPLERQQCIIDRVKKSQREVSVNDIKENHLDKDINDTCNDPPVKKVNHDGLRNGEAYQGST